MTEQHVMHNKTLGNSAWYKW